MSRPRPTGEIHDDEPPAGLTRDDWTQIRRAARKLEYHASPVANVGGAPALQAPNRQQGYRTTFRRDGVEIATGDQRAASWRLGVSVTGYGYEGDVLPVAPVDPRPVEERVEYHRGPLTEWYVNRPGGLEQGFELEEPKAKRAQPVVITMAVHGDLDMSATGEAVLFAERDGRTVVRYAGLKAWDAGGHPLRSRLEAAGRQLRLVVEAQTARFPVTVDPTFVHEAQLFGHDEMVGQENARLGLSASVSGDTAVIGADQMNTPAACCLGAAHVFVRSGTTWTLQQTLMQSDGANTDFFGYSVSISGDTVVVGAYGDDTGAGFAAGSAYVFVRSGTTWSQQQKLLPADGMADDRFGYSVSISGDTVVAGAHQDDPLTGTNAGSAYVFVRSGTTWSEQQKLLASDGGPGDHLGFAVSISSDTAVVGAYADDTASGTEVGSAYVFVRSGTTWTEQQKLLASDGAGGDQFGNQVSIAGDTVVVAAYGDDIPAGADTGSAYVFVRAGTTWTEQQKLLASDGAGSDQFGSAVSISGDTVVVGASKDDTPGSDAGSAYVFVRSGTVWTEQQKLVALGGSTFAFFGFSVSVSGDTVVVGAYGDDSLPGTADAGSAHIFVRSGTTWTEQQEILGPDDQYFDQFGYSVSLSGDTVIVGAPGDDVAPGGERAGSAYVFVRSGAVWTEQQKLVAPDGSVIDSFGSSVSISGDTAVVGATGFATAAYVFVRSGTTWTEQQKLLASDGAGGAFGSAVSISGDTAVVGAPFADIPGGVDAGSAYVFVRSGTTWTQQQKLLAPDGASGDNLGFSVSLSGDTVVLGAPQDDTPGAADTGSAYVFFRSGTTWALQQKLVPPDADLGDRCGESVAIDGDTIVVGAPRDDNANGANAGSASVFVRSGVTWTQQQKLLASDGGRSAFFGRSVSISGDTAVIGAWLAGSAYVFARSGTTWTEQQKLVAPDGGLDGFGASLSLSGDTVAVGVPGDKTPAAISAGSVHVFRQAQADLGVTKTDGQTTAVPGQPITYTIVASNAGPTGAPGAGVVDRVPAEILAPTWTCSASPGSSCTGSSGSGSIDDTVNLAVGGSVTYTLTGTVASGATGALSNTASVTPPAGVPDPNPANDSATDTDTLGPETDLGLTKADSADPVFPGDPLGYALSITNAGPSDATSVTVIDTLPADVSFVSSSPGPPTCSFAGAVITCSLGTLAAGSTAVVTIDVTVNGPASGSLVNTATVSGSEADTDPANNSASATTTVLRAEAELAHGFDTVYDLAAQPGPSADEDLFRISQSPHSSYEVVVEGTSGDIGAGSGPFLERIATDGATVIQGSSPIGAGPSRSLRWSNTTAVLVQGETVRVRSAECGTDCGTDDVYRIRVYETTCSVPRFNNAGTQVTVLIVQNRANDAVAGEAYFRDSAATLVAVLPFSLNPQATLVLNTTTVPGANGVSGTITIAHDGRYGDLSGKTVAVEPATGFSFDSPLEVRPR